MYRALFVSSLFVVAGLPLLAQAPAPQTPVPAAPGANAFYVSGGLGMPGMMGGGVNLYSHQSSFNLGKPITGAPYSAEQVTEHVQTLADGNRIVNTSTTKVYRDSQGRTRTETSLPALAGAPAPPLMVSISDPVAGVTYLLDSNTKTAHKLPRLTLEVPNAKTLPITPAPAMPSITFSVLTKNTNPAPKVEDLGIQQISGVNAKGTRTTETIPAGAIGNEQPIEVVSERWMSPELQITVKTTYNDPRMGQTTETLNDLDRSEPDPSRFQVPADYTVVESKGPQFTILDEKGAQSITAKKAAEAQAK